MSKILRKKDDFKGPKTFEEWVEVYERRSGDDVEFIVSEGEQVYYHPDHGFFTWWIDYENGRMVIPKMVGNGKFLRHIIYKMMVDLRPTGCDEIYCCSNRPPEVYTSVLGGKLDKTEEKIDEETGEKRTLYFYIVTFDDTKEVSLNEAREKEFALPISD